MEPISLRTPLALLLISLSAIAAVWWWLATPITLPRAPIDPDAKLQCVSYAPFRDLQTPLQPTTHIGPDQIAQDLDGGPDRSPPEAIGPEHPREPRLHHNTLLERLGFASRLP